MHFTIPFYGEVNRVMMRRLKYIPRVVKFGERTLLYRRVYRPVSQGTSREIGLLIGNILLVGA